MTEDMVKIQSCGNNMDFDNLIRNEVTKLSDNKFITYYIVVMFTHRSAVNHLLEIDTLGLVIVIIRCHTEIVVESVIILNVKKTNFDIRSAKIGCFLTQYISLIINIKL
jgi:hypothetical protein